MAFDLTSLSISVAGAVVGGVWLGYVVATRSAHRRLWHGALWVSLVLLMTAGRGWLPAEALAGLALVALCASPGFQDGREQRNAARSLGASEWRIFWRVMLPMGWQGAAGGALLLTMRMAVEYL